jgi:MarR family transcriptional regulator, organic hydroperoxide resistance regulator
MTPPQLFLMMSLYERDNVTASELATHIQLDKSTLTGMLSRLELRKYIMRTTDENDGRSVRVTLTEKGRKLRRPLTIIYQDINRRVLEALGPQAEQLNCFLDALEQAAEKSE